MLSRERKRRRKRRKRRKRNMWKEQREEMNIVSGHLTAAAFWRPFFVIEGRCSELPHCLF